MYGYALTSRGENETADQLKTFDTLEETKDSALQKIVESLKNSAMDSGRQDDYKTDVQAWLASDVTEREINRYGRVALEAYNYGAHLFTVRFELI